MAERRNVKTDGFPYPSNWLDAVRECRRIANKSTDETFLTGIAWGVADRLGFDRDDLLAHWKEADWQDAKGAA